MKKGIAGKMQKQGTSIKYHLLIKVKPQSPKEEYPELSGKGD